MIDESSLFKEIKYRTSRSSGSGGQHVNKVETRVEAIFNIQETGTLSEEQTQLILVKIGKRFNSSGELVISSDSTKSQAQNKTIAKKRLIDLIKSAVTKTKKRINTSVPKSVKRKRLKEKKATSEKKSRRSHNSFDD